LNLVQRKVHLTGYSCSLGLLRTSSPTVQSRALRERQTDCGVDRQGNPMMVNTFKFVHPCLRLISALILSTTPAVTAWSYCPCGYSCPVKLPNGWDDRVLCPVGTYCPPGTYLQSTFPIPCPAGMLCPAVGACKPQGCPCGSYCPAGSSNPIPCPEGSYCPANFSAPISCSEFPCPADNRCPPPCDPAICDPLNPPKGYFCSLEPTMGCGLICYHPAYCKIGDIPY
jgi:hypothetical protein